jgi:hypothetical protein
MLKNKLLSAMGGEPSDPDFENVAILLRGDGTNGGQNGVFTDTSSNNYTIARVFEPTQVYSPTQVLFSPYAPNWSNSFDGSGDSLQTTAVNISTGNFTVEAWVYLNTMPTTDSWPGSFANWMVVVGVGTATFGDGWQFRIGQTVLAFGTNSDSTAISATHNMTVGQWYHLAVTRSGNVYTLYRNGTSIGSATYTANNPGTGAFTWIGTETNEGAYLNGYISNARVNSTAVYTSNFTPPINPLIAIAGTSLLTCQSNRFIDASSNNFAITPFGQASVQVFSPFSLTEPYGATTTAGSVRFTGGNSYQSKVTAPAAAFNVGTATDFTMEFWLNSDSLNNYYRFVGQWGTFATFQFGILDDRVSVQDSGGTYTTTLFSSGIRSRQWNHFALVRQGTTCKVYLNGVGFTLSGNPNITPNAAQNVGIGGLLDEDGQGVRNAFMAGFRMVKGNALYTSNFTPPTTPPTAVTNTSLLLNFSSPGIVDSSAQNVVFPQDNAQISTSVRKYGTGSMVFDGSGDVLLSPGNFGFVLGSSNFTIEGWFNSNSFASNQNLVSRYESFFGSFQGYVFSIPNSTTLRFTRGDGIVLNGTVSTMSTGTWYHIAAVRNGSTLTLYLNGVQAAQATGVTNFSDARFDLEIGSSMNGYIDDFRITKGIARYTANFTPPTQALPNK